MQDPKYIIVENKLHHISGYTLPENEPVMIFRAKDIGSLVAIMAYINMLLDQPMNKSIESHLVSSVERLKEFTNYQSKNKRLQSVTCSQKDHGFESKEILRSARSMLYQLVE